MSLKVSAQAAVPHADIAVVTSLALLITEIGGAISTAMCTFSFSLSPSPCLLTHIFSLSCRHLVRHDALSPRASPPFLSDADRALLYSSIYGAAQFTCGHPVRESVFLAYDDVMKIVAIVATVFGALPLVISFWMPDWWLGDQQNAADNVDLRGERVGNPDVDGQTSERK